MILTLFLIQALRTMPHLTILPLVAWPNWLKKSTASLGFPGTSNTACESSFLISTNGLLHDLTKLHPVSCHAAKLAVDALIDAFTGLNPEDYPDRTIRIPDITFTSPEFEEEIAMDLVSFSAVDERDSDSALDNIEEAADGGDEADGEAEEGNDDEVEAEGGTSPDPKLSKEEVKARRKEAAKVRLAEAKAARVLWRKREKASPVGQVRYFLFIFQSCCEINR